jgi:hypothetical protein
MIHAQLVAVWRKMATITAFGALCRAPSLTSRTDPLFVYLCRYLRTRRTDPRAPRRPRAGQRRPTPSSLRCARARRPPASPMAPRPRRVASAPGVGCTTPRRPPSCGGRRGSCASSAGCGTLTSRTAWATGGSATGARPPGAASAAASSAVAVRSPRFRGALCARVCGACNVSVGTCRPCTSTFCATGARGTNVLFISALLSLVATLGMSQTHAAARTTDSRV